MFRVLNMENLITRVKSICDELARDDGTGGQVALASAAGASKSVVNQWLAGKIKSIDINYALEIERTLGYNHIWLMIGKGERKVAIGSSNAPLPSTTAIGESEGERGETQSGLRQQRAGQFAVSLENLILINGINEREAAILRRYRMADENSARMIEVAARVARPRSLGVVDNDQAEHGTTGAG